MSQPGNTNCTGRVYWLSLGITAPNGSGICEHLSLVFPQTLLLIPGSGTPALPGCPRARNPSKSQISQHPPDNWGTTHPELSLGVFLSFFFAKSGLGTHRILLPLLAFLSTFFLILLRSFWMANHCLGNAEQENNFRALNTL